MVSIDSSSLERSRNMVVEQKNLALFFSLKVLRPFLSNSKSVVGGAVHSWPLSSFRADYGSQTPVIHFFFFCFVFFLIVAQRGSAVIFHSSPSLDIRKMP